MKSNLMSTLIMGSAVLGFTLAAEQINANAAKVTSNGFHALNSNPNNRNVTFTGNNAVYNKPATLSGKKEVVISKATLSILAASTNSKNNFRAYGYTKTNLGSIYYKVVSFDGQYRGWVYGGKSVNKFSGGLKPFTTTVFSNPSSTESKQTYVFNNPGSQNDGTAVTYKAPMYTQYKIGRQVTDTTDFANDKLKITKAATRTREGDRWVYVTDSEHSEVNGWINAKGLKAYKSTGVNQTTVSMVFNYSNYDVAGQKTTNFISNTSGLSLLFNSNVNFTNAVNTFNRDTDVKGNKSDVLAKDDLVNTLTKDGLASVYMKITPTLIPRIGGGILDNLDTTGLFMKFNLDTDALPSVVHYGDNIRLSYTIEPSFIYVKAPEQSIIDDQTKNEDGYYSIVISNDLIREIIDLIATNEF